MGPERGVNAITHEDNRGNRVASTEITTEQGRRFSVATQALPRFPGDRTRQYITLFFPTNPRGKGRPQIALLNENEVTNKRTARKMHKETVANVIQLLEEGKPSLIASVFRNRDIQLLFETHNPQ